MPSNERDGTYYDPEEFNTHAGITGQANDDSSSSSHSGSFKKQVITDQDESSKKHIIKPYFETETEKVKNAEVSTSSFENKAYKWDDVPLEPQDKNEVSFDEDIKKESVTKQSIKASPSITITTEKYEMKKRVTKTINLDQEKRSIIKNVLIICIAFMLLFTAYSSMSALQSSINAVIIFLVITIVAYNYFSISSSNI